MPRPSRALQDLHQKELHLLWSCIMLDMTRIATEFECHVV